jgi:hypothetical protein
MLVFLWSFVIDVTTKVLLLLLFAALLLAASLLLLLLVHHLQHSRLIVLVHRLRHSRLLVHRLRHPCWFIAFDTLVSVVGSSPSTISSRLLAHYLQQSRLLKHSKFSRTSRSSLLVVYMFQAGLIYCI